MSTSRDPITKTRLTRRSLIKDGTTVGYEFTMQLVVHTGAILGEVTLHNSLTYIAPEDAIDSMTGTKPDALSLKYHEGVASDVYCALRAGGERSPSR